MGHSANYQQAVELKILNSFIFCSHIVVKSNNLRIFGRVLLNIEQFHPSKANADISIRHIESTILNSKMLSEDTLSATSKTPEDQFPP